MNITVFRVQTGQIAKTVQCPAGMANIQCQQGEDWIDGAYLGDAYYIDNFTPITKPPKPSEHHIFDYTTKQWVDPRTPETEWSLVRQKRNRLLLASDWTQLPDAPAASKAQWAAYRQALRDITEQPDPFSVVWPSPPAQ